MDIHPDDREQAARILGMKPSEIVDVTEVERGHVITTHDKQQTLVYPGAVGWCAEPYTGDLPGEPEPEASAEPAQSAEPETPPAPGPQTPDGGGEGEPVPDGTADQVLAWVGEDGERAAAALAAEQARKKPRTTLVEALQKLAQPPA